MINTGTSTARPAPLAIVGLSCLFPKADSLETFWSNLRQGVDAITEIPPTHWSPDAYFDADPKSPDMTYARRGGFLSPLPFDPLEFGIAPSNLEAIDTSQLLSLVAAKRALEHAGYGDGGKSFDRSRAGCILGVTGALEMVVPLGARLGHPKWRQALRDAGVPSDVAEDVIQRIGEAYVPWQENSFPGLLGNVVAGRIANRLDLGGTNCVVDAACASSLSAIHLAALELWTGRSDLVLTGGVDTFNDIFMYMCFSKTPALSPTGDARPFAENADGTILGEGVGVLVLKRLADAQRDGDRIYALIRGIGTSSDGAGNAVYAPKKEGQIRCLKDAYRIAGVSPDTIELVEAHGTGTKVGDAVEAAGLSEVFRASGRRGRWCAMGSVKSQIGHTKAAAGAAGIIKAVLALHHRVLPPTIKVERPQDALLSDDSPLYVNTQPRPWLASPDHPRRAGVSAFGFGGSNFHCVLEEAPTVNAEPDWDGDVTIAAFSGDSLNAVQSQLESWRLANDWPVVRQRATLSRGAFDCTAEHRLLIVLERDRGDFAAVFVNAAAMLQKYADKPQWSTPDGTYYGRGERSGKLAVLFPGQGSQSVGMLRDLACRFPILQDVLAEADDAYAALEDAEQRLSDFIYPPPAFSDAERERRELALRATQVAQPAIGAASLGALAVLKQFGVKPEITAGHSYGELTALCASKRFQPAALYRLSTLRGRLMAEAQEIDGGMLAVGAPLSQVELAIREAAVDLVVANRNGPNQVVLSGRLPEIDRAAELFARRNIRGRKLPVGAAFHSPLVATASERFRPVLAEVEFSAAEVPVYANSSAGEYPGDPDAARDLLAGQLARPVEFVQQIENMYDAGARTFLEVGPGNVLTGLVGSILSGRDHRAVALDASVGKRSGMYDLALVLAQLAAGGYAVRLEEWDPTPPLAEIVDPQRLRIPLSGANYVKPRPPRPARPPMWAARKSEVAQSVAGDGVFAAPRMRDGFSGGGEDAVASHPVVCETLSSQSQSARPAGPAAKQADSLSASLVVLQRMQQETARLHRQFLEGQDTALRTLDALLRQGGGRVSTVNVAPPASSEVSEAILVTSAERGTRNAEQENTFHPTISAPRHSQTTALTSIVLAVVAEKTGYPVEMLQPKMSLDHDLGIDSIKRVEILSALQERLPELPAVTPEQLQTLHRLSDVIALLENSEPKAEVRAHRSDAAGGSLTPTVLAVVAEKTGYPIEMLQPKMSLDHDLGIDSIKRVEILSALQEKLPELPAVTPEQLQTLHRLQDVIELLENSSGKSEVGSGKGEVVSESVHFAATPLDNVPAAPLYRAVVRAVPSSDESRTPLPLPAGGEFWVTDDGSELSHELVERLSSAGFRARIVPFDEPVAPALTGPLAGLMVVSPATGISDARLWQALAWLQAAGPELKRTAASSHAAVVATVSRLDGACGFGGADRAIVDVASGGLAGLTKTVRHEWPELVCKAIDLADGWDSPAAAAAALGDELLHVGPMECGLSPRGRIELQIVEESGGATGDDFPLQSDDLVIVTGGARGVTAAAAIALAKRCRPRLVLCGRSPSPQPEPDFLCGLTSEPQIKQALARQGTAATPRELQEQCQQILASREIEQTLKSLRDLGAKAEYCSVDVRDLSAVSEFVARVQREYGPVRGVVHGAGVLADQRIEDKSREQFERVFGTKVTGLRNLLAALEAVGQTFLSAEERQAGMPAPHTLHALVLFSSFTGRYGRTGQIDYAIANEVLNKTAQQFQRQHSECRVIAFNWGPWDGGMVQGGLNDLFAKEGIGLIPLPAGADLVVQELARPASAGEVEVLVLGQRRAKGLGLSATGRNEEGASENSSPFLSPQPLALNHSNPQPLALSIAFERVLSVASCPCLASHVLGGKAVFPVALIVEWLAHAAMHRNPGLEFLGFNQLQVFKGVRLDAHQSLRLQTLAGKPQRAGNQFLADIQLVSDAGDRTTIHASAEMVLGSTRAAPTNDRSLTVAGSTWTGDIYSQLFHGPAFRGIVRVEQCGPDGIAVFSRTAPPPAEWTSDPLRGAWLADPLAFDCALQAIILWSRQQRQQPCLPCGIGRYRQYRRAFPTDGVQIAIRTALPQAHLIRAALEFRDAAGQLVAQMDDCDSVVDASLTAAFAQNVLVD